MGVKRKKYGHPAKNRPAPLMGDLYKKANPTGNADPRTLGGNIIGDLDADSNSRNAVILDMTDVVLLQHLSVSVVEAVRQSAWDGEMFYLLAEGRVNKTDREVRVGFITDTDGVAALISELLAIAHRGGAELLDDVTRRLTDLHQGHHVDLHWLKAAVDNAIALQEDSDV